MDEHGAATNGMSAQVQAMFARIAPRYDAANDILSFGLHRLWRRRVVLEVQARPGQSVLDCATGTGDLALAFKASVGKAGSVIGTDFCAAMLLPAPLKAQRAHLDVSFQVADAQALPYPDRSFDIASIAFGIRNVDSPVLCLREMARVVKPGGRVAVLEFGQPAGLFRHPYTFYSRSIMPILGGLITGDRSAYEYLPRTAATFPCRDHFLALMDSTDLFASTRYVLLTFGIACLYLGEVK